MNTRLRRGPATGADVRRAPYGLGTPGGALAGRPGPRNIAGQAMGAEPEVGWPRANPACSTNGGRPRHHPLANRAANERLAAYEQAVRQRFNAIVPVLKEVARHQLQADFVERTQAIALSQLGFELPLEVLQDAWILKLDMAALYGSSVLSSVLLNAEEARAIAPALREGVDEAISFFLECGFHAVDITPCSDGRLKGLIRYILRLPDGAVRSCKAYAGAMFDVDASVRQWVETELMRFREGNPVTADVGTRYLKVAVYHWSSSDATGAGCAAHGSNQRAAAKAALERLQQFRQAIENSFCCGASVDTLLVGVDTDTDAIKVHIPDADGEMNLYRVVDNLELYCQTVNENIVDVEMKVQQAIQEASAAGGWWAGNGEPHEGMRLMIRALLMNNMSQIEYVCSYWGGRYPDIGHAEWFINVGDPFEEMQVRNLAYLAYLYTVEEGAPDLDVGIKIFKKLNVVHWAASADCYSLSL